MQRTILLGLTLAAALVCGCRKSVTYTGENGTKATISKSGKDYEVTFHGNKGETVRIAGSEASVALPEGFPKDVPIYPGAKVAASVKSQDGMHVTLQTSDAGSKVSDFYKEQMKAQGWAIDTTMDMPQGTMLMGNKSGQALHVMVMSDDKATTVTLTVTQAK
jgi:hypothetical protein